jgi:acylphosphatase
VPIVDTVNSGVKVSELARLRNRSLRKIFSYDAIHLGTGSCNVDWNSHQAIMVKHLKISGSVQGVGFRYHMIRVARELGITGWVRNRLDGSVEAMVAGAPDAVEKIIAWTRRGPGHAAVTSVEISEVNGSFERFEMLPTE